MVEPFAVKVVRIGRDENPIASDEVSVDKEKKLQDVNLRFSGIGCGLG